MRVRTVNWTFFYRSELHLRSWAARELCQYLAYGEHPQLLAVVAKRRVGRVTLAVLHFLVTRRPLEAASSFDRNALTSISARAVAEVVCCHPRSASRAVNFLNSVEPAPIFLVHDRGVCALHPSLRDVRRAEAFNARRKAALERNATGVASAYAHLTFQEQLDVFANLPAEKRAAALQSVS